MPDGSENFTEIVAASIAADHQAQIELSNAMAVVHHKAVTKNLDALTFRVQMTALIIGAVSSGVWLLLVACAIYVLRRA